MMITGKGKILWKLKNAGIVYVGSAYPGTYAPGVSIQIFRLMKNIYTLKKQSISISLM
jgi:hypothetical protein